MNVVLFEDEKWSRFVPFTTMRHLSLLACGTGTLLQYALRETGSLALAGREYLNATTRERTGLEFNTKADGRVLLVNSRLRPSAWQISKKIENEDSKIISGGDVAMVTVQAPILEKLIGHHDDDDDDDDDGVISQAELQRLKKAEVLDSPKKLLFAYPWELVAENSRLISGQRVDTGERLPPPLHGEGYIVKGDAASLFVSPRAQIDEYTSFDVRGGPIVVEDEAEIEAFSHISGPSFIGRGTKIHSALIRGGTTIGEGCKIGGEVENSIISAHTNKAHYGYVGNSMVGEWVNLGAGSVFSDLKNTYGTIRVELPEGRIDTGLIKSGPMIGDMSKVAIGCRVFTGKRVGVSSHLLGLVDRNVPDFVFCRSKDEMVELELESAVETQRRMMARRNLQLSAEQERLIRYVYSATDAERRTAGVAKGKLGL